MKERKKSRAIDNKKNLRVLRIGAVDFGRLIGASRRELKIIHGWASSMSGAGDDGEAVRAPGGSENLNEKTQNGGRGSNVGEKARKSARTRGQGRSGVERSVGGKIGDDTAYNRMWGGAELIANISGDKKP